MHHLKETIIDGVKFILIPETLYQALKDRARDYAQYTGFGLSTVESIADFEEHPHGL